MKHFNLCAIIILDPILRISRGKTDLVGNWNNIRSSYDVVFCFLPQIYPKNWKFEGLLPNRSGAPVL